MFMYLCVKAVENVEKYGLPFNTLVTITMEDFFDICSRTKWTDQKKNERKEFREELLGLMGKKFIIENDKELYAYHYVDFIHIDKESYIAKAGLSERTKDLVYKTVGNYTKIEFGNYACLRLKYSKDLYKYLRSYALIAKGKGHNIPLEKMYNIFNIPEESSYRKSIKDFKERILIPAIQEINEKTDLKIRGLFDVQQKLYEKMVEKKGANNITSRDKAKISVDAMTLKEKNKVIGFECIINEKPVEERYGYVKNEKLRKQLINNLKKQIEHNKKAKVLKDFAPDEIDPEVARIIADKMVKKSN